MNEVLVAGIGQVAAGEHWDISLRELGVEAILQALRDAGGLRPQMLAVGNMLAPILSHQAHIGALLADYAGLSGIEAVTVEASDASGAAALRQAWLAVKSGFVDAALAVGVEKFTDQVGADVDLALATGTDSDFELEQGVTPAAQAALLARRYLYEHHLGKEALAPFPLLAHANGVHNPRAMFRKAISPRVYEAAPMVQDPLNVFDAAPYVDGAAAVLLVRDDLLMDAGLRPRVALRASASVTDAMALHDRHDLLAFEAARLSWQKALSKAQVSDEEIDFFEYFDAFSIYAALTLEAIGAAPRGGAGQLAAEGAFALNGRLPCATQGGLKARGHAGGATGLYQAVETVLQLRGAAGAAQVQGARIGVTQSLAGPASLALTHVFTRLDA